MGAWHFFVLSAGSPHAHKILLLGGGGGWGFLEGGGGVEAPILFLWPWGFFLIVRKQQRRNSNDSQVTAYSPEVATNLWKPPLRRLCRAGDWQSQSKQP